MSILVTGATGQIGSELIPHLQNRYGHDNVIAGILINQGPQNGTIDGPLVEIDVTKRETIEKALQKFNVDTVYHLAGILSARGEKNPDMAWETNVLGLKHILDLSLKFKVKKIFWPSSIAAFGPTTPRVMTPQQTILEPRTMYGVNKVEGELLVNYYSQKYNLDIRSLRLPGIVSYKTEPGGGTTDFAVAMFYEALKTQHYECFVRPDTLLPMMYMDDAIYAIDKLMNAPAERLSIHTSYNITALSFTAEQLAAAITKRIPGFTCTYKPDFRQAIADSWPQTIDDNVSRRDWDWSPRYDLDGMVDEMLAHLQDKLQANG